MAAHFDPYSSNAYGGYQQQNQADLQFFSSGSGNQQDYSRPSLEGNVGSGGVQNGTYVAGQIEGGFWSAFTASGYPDEPPLMEELGINFGHIKAKSFAAMNPFTKPDQHIMDDTDLAGPLLYCFCFGTFLLFSGKPQFGYIYGVGLLGVIAIYTLLNLMSPTGININRVASVLGYCLLPLVLMSFLSVVLSMDGLLGYVISSLSILWCSYSASGIFVSVLQMSQQRLLVAYPVGLFYASFGLLSVFNFTSGKIGV